MFTVLVPGRLGLSVPIELLMRALPHGDSGRTASLLRDLDLFRWEEDSSGNVFVRPRLALEARLICERRLGGPDAEIQVLLQLLKRVRPTLQRDSPDLRFLLQMCWAIGPNGPEQARYARFYRDMADGIAAWRRSHGIQNSAVMLQEATLKREYVKHCRGDQLSGPEAIRLLLEGVQTLQEALRSMEPENISRRHQANLTVELAATYGFLAHQLSRSNAPVDEVLGRYRDAREWARRASNSAPDNFYPVDVALWNSLDMLRDDRLASAERAELTADILDSLDLVDEEALDNLQYAQFQERRQQAGTVMEDQHLEESAYRELLRVGSAAGVLLRTRAVAGEYIFLEPVSSGSVARAQGALGLLREHWPLVRSDARALRYMLRLWWLAKTGTVLFKGERRPLPGEHRAVREALEIIEQLRTLEGANASPFVLYLAAALLWQAGEFQTARELWVHLGSEVELAYARRVVKHHVMADERGQPRLFHGQIHSVDVPGRRARVLVEELRQEVELLPRDFGLDPRNDIWKGKAVPEFCIAFNFIGPIADPKRPPTHSPTGHGDHGQL
jgi:hypothetical protein